MRGTKLTAWRIPPVWIKLQEKTLIIPESSTVPQNQKKALQATNAVLTAVAKDMREGLLETVGVESSFAIDNERCGMRLELPAGTDTELIARAIDAENVEAWCDASGQVYLAVDPWYSTKDVDQSVLCAIKVIHVLLGIHAADTLPPKSLKEKLLTSIAEVMQIQQKPDNKKK